jgi:hypothetical protein
VAREFRSAQADTDGFGIQSQLNSPFCRPLKKKKKEAAGQFQATGDHLAHSFSSFSQTISSMAM